MPSTNEETYNKKYLRYDVPEVSCQDNTKHQCTDLTFLEHVTSTQYIQTMQPGYEGNCSPRELTLEQQKCVPKKPTFYRF